MHIGYSVSIILLMILCVQCISSYSNFDYIQRKDEADMLAAGIILFQAAIFFSFIHTMSYSKKELPPKNIYLKDYGVSLAV